MSSKIWQKRKMKIQGSLHQASSYFLLRHTRFNQKQLKKEIKSHAIDQLHVGCGHVLLPDWLNIRYEVREEYGRLKKIKGGWLLNYNLLKSWPIEDDSINYIAGSHFIEHLDLNHGIQFLKESFRVMKKGGAIRLSCPDLELYARNYVNNNKSFFDHKLIREWCTFKAAQTPGEIFIAKAYDSGGSHKWFHDFASLKHILETAGFGHVKRVGRLEGQVPDLKQLEPAERELETVYVEAVK